MDAAERQLLEETVRDAVTDASVSGADAAAIDKVLTDLGWLEMLDAEPRDAIAIVFTALGLANGAASALDDVIATAVARTVPLSTRPGTPQDPYAGSTTASPLCGVTPSAAATTSSSAEEAAFDSPSAVNTMAVASRGSASSISSQPRSVSTLSTAAGSAPDTTASVIASRTVSSSS